MKVLFKPEKVHVRSFNVLDFSEKNFVKDSEVVVMDDLKELSWTARDLNTFNFNDYISDFSVVLGLKDLHSLVEIFEDIEKNENTHNVNPEGAESFIGVNITSWPQTVHFNFLRYRSIDVEEDFQIKSKIADLKKIKIECEKSIRMKTSILSDINRKLQELGDTENES